MKNNIPLLVLKALFLTFLFQQNPLTSSAQNPVLDSLRNIWNDTNQEDSTRLEAHTKLISRGGYLSIKIDSGLIMIRENLDLALVNGRDIDKGRAYNLLAVYHAINQDPKESAKYFEKAETFFQKIKKWDAVLMTKFNIARSHISMGNSSKIVQKLEEVLATAKQHDNLEYELYAKQALAKHYRENGSTKMAMDYYKDAIKIIQKMNQPKDEAQIYIAMGIVEEKAKNYEEAEIYFKKGHEKSQSVNDFHGQIYSYSNLARMESLKGDSILALRYHEKSLHLADSLKIIEDKMSVLPEVVKFYFERKDTLTAKSYVDELTRLSKKTTFPTLLAPAYLYAGIIEMYEKNEAAALDYCKKAKDILIQNKINKDLQNVCDCIYKAEKKLGNDKAALAALEEYMVVRDTLFNEDREISFARLTTEYKYEKEQEIKDAKYQADLERQKLIQMGLGIGATLLALLAFLAYRNFRNKAKANALLEEKNHLISEQKAALERTNYTKDRLFAILGHDLRKPANAFQGIARKVNYLLKKEDYERVQELGDSIETNALGLTSLTDNLLKWALTQKEAISIHPESLDLNQIIRETKVVLGRLAEAKEIEIISEIPEGTQIFADKNSMLTIIRNLLDNAIKYTPEGGTVTLSCQESATGIDIYVKDTGVGIPEDKTRTLFLLQEGKSTQGTKGEKGTGLGLHLVKELVDLNHGNISVSSQLNEGTTFIIKLPKAA